MHLAASNIIDLKIYFNTF